MSAFADTGPQAALLGDGRRLHLQHGPIDLIIEADGPGDEVADAYRDAAGAFRTVLTGLVGEIGLLRSPVSGRSGKPEGEIARRMWNAVAPHAAAHFVTPMAAVAGAVADHVLGHLLAGRNLRRAYVNNGGDIAIFLAPGAVFDIAVSAGERVGADSPMTRLCHDDGVGGIATSGWRGRSHSLGIADAVTVHAANAASADAAATLIANAVNVEAASGIRRVPANELSPDSDLGTRLVTVDVPPLSRPEIAHALGQGAKCARRMAEQGLIEAARIELQGEVLVVDASTSPAGHRARRGRLEYA